MSFGGESSGCRPYRVVRTNDGMKTPRAGCPRHLTASNDRQPVAGKTTARLRPRFAAPKTLGAWVWVAVGLGWGFFGLTPGSGLAEVVPVETNAPAFDPAVAIEETDSLRALEAIREVHEQLRSNQLAIVRTGEEVRAAAAEHATLLSNGLLTIERVLAAQQESLSAQSARELEALSSGSVL